MVFSGKCLKTVGVQQTKYTSINYKECLNKYLLMNITNNDSEVLSKDKNIKGEQLLKMQKD